MKKFEYKILTTQWVDSESLFQIQELLNQEGEQGWELITHHKDEYPDKPSYGEQIILIFKREVIP